MIQLEIEPIEIYNYSNMYNASFVMHQTRANECFRLDLPTIRFDFKRRLNDRYREAENKLKTLKKTANYIRNPKDKRTIDFESIRIKSKKAKELEIFNNKLNEYVEVTTFMTESFSSNEELENKLIDAVTEFDEKFLIVK